MELAPSTWYRVADLLDGSSAPLKDGSLIRCSSRQFGGSTLQALTGLAMTDHDRLSGRESSRCYEYLQLTLLNVDRADLDGLPPAFSISSQLLRENMLYVAESSYAYDILVRKSQETYYSKGAVCVVLALDHEYQSDRHLLQKNREVETAYRRGLLDEERKAKAVFRLQNKPMIRKLAALQDSEYLPENEWRVDVVFAYWHEQRTHELVPSPIGSNRDDPVSFEELKIQFALRTRPRDFQVSDLFLKT